MRRGVLTVLLLLAVAACQPPPRPFQPESKAIELGSPLAPGPDAGVTVVPITGLPAEQSRVLGAAVAERLRRLEIPASSHTSHPGSYILQGEASAVPAKRTGQVLVVRWRLIDPGGLVAGSVEQHEPLSGATGASLGADQVARLAQGAAAAMEPLIHRDNVRPPARPKVVVQAVEGAPGDGRTSLARALRTILGRYQVQVVENASKDTFLVQGTVRRKPQGSTELIEIAWTVLRADGSRLGSVSQANTVPKGTLDGPWGEIAYAAAEGGAQGVAQILRAAPTAAAARSGT